jgi:hypothetical protein
MLSACPSVHMCNHVTKAVSVKRPYACNSAVAPERECPIPVPFIHQCPRAIEGVRPRPSLEGLLTYRSREIKEIRNTPQKIFSREIGKQTRKQTKSRRNLHVLYVVRFFVICANINLEQKEGQTI